MATLSSTLEFHEIQLGGGVSDYYMIVTNAQTFRNSAGLKETHSERRQPKIIHRPDAMKLMDMGMMPTQWTDLDAFMEYGK